MRKIFITLISLLILPLQAVELEGRVSDYVEKACQNELSTYCNEHINLEKFLTIYANNFEGYMQSNIEEDINRMVNDFYTAELCIKEFHPENHNEITATIKGSMLYSKERFSLYIKSDRKLVKVLEKNNFVLPSLPIENKEEYCNAMI